MEAAERAERLDDVTAQLMLLSAVRKVGFGVRRRDGRGSRAVGRSFGGDQLSRGGVASPSDAVGGPQGGGRWDAAPRDE